MAGLQAGALEKFDCQRCQVNKGINELFGCSQKALRPAFVEQDGGKIYQYWNCPIKFIPQNILDFSRKYRYYKTFQGAMPRFQEVSGRFIYCYEYFENKKAEQQAHMMKREASRMSTPRRAK